MLKYDLFSVEVSTAFSIMQNAKYVFTVKLYGTLTAISVIPKS